MRPTGFPKLYPWEQWLDAKPHLLIPGQHFHCSHDSFRSAAHAASERRYCRVHTAKLGPFFLLLSYDHHAPGTQAAAAEGET